jgi:hypothetical protein
LTHPDAAISHIVALHLPIGDALCRPLSRGIGSRSQMSEEVFSGAASGSVQT